MRVDLLDCWDLRFADGAPVRAASGVTRHRAGWLVVQDDATHACLWDGQEGTPVRLLPPVAGLDLFEESNGTKDLKPDLEAVVSLPDGSALVLGSGSTPARMRAARLVDAVPEVIDLSPVYRRVADALGVAADRLNLEGACLVDDRLRWFQRGLPGAGVPTASVDVSLSALLSDPGAVEVVAVHSYDLGTVSGVALAVTDAVSDPVTLGGGRVLVSAAAEDSATTYDDGPVLGSALVLLDGPRVVASARLPPVDGEAAKVEGLALVGRAGDLLDVLDVLDVVAVLDADDPTRPSRMLTLRVALDPGESF